jgi:hypothetical protein
MQRTQWKINGLDPETFCLPVLDRTTFRSPFLWLNITKQSLGIFEQRCMVCPQNRYYMLAPLKTEVEERRFHVQRISDNNVEESAIEKYIVELTTEERKELSV